MACSKVTMTAPGVEINYPVGMGWLDSGDTIDSVTEHAVSDANISTSNYTVGTAAKTINGYTFAIGHWFAVTITNTASVEAGDQYVEMDVQTTNGEQRIYRQDITVKDHIDL